VIVIRAPAKKTLTQHGRSAAVVLDVAHYEALLEEVEAIREIREARAELDRGEGIPHTDAIARQCERNGSRTGDSHDRLGLRTEITSAQYGMLRWSGALAM